MKVGFEQFKVHDVDLAELEEMERLESAIDYNKLDPLTKIRDEFDPNFLERLGVKSKLKRLLTERQDITYEEYQFKMVAAITSELYYIKACVNCLSSFDPVAARARVYLATIGYDIFVTSTLLQKAQEEAQHAQESRDAIGENQRTQRINQGRAKPLFAKLLDTVKGKLKKAKVPLATKQDEMRLQNLNTQNEHFGNTIVTLIERVDISQKDTEALLEGQHVTLDDFIIETLKFAVENVEDKLKDLTGTEKLVLFCKNVVFPFARRCNLEARYFYMNLTSMPFSLRVLRERGTKDKEEIYKIATEDYETRGLTLFRSEVWIKDLFSIITNYQMVLTPDQNSNLHLRTFRAAYATHERGPDTSDQFFERATVHAKQCSPFLQLDFMFRYLDVSLFDCFDAEKVSQENIDSLFDEVEDAKGLVLDKYELTPILQNEFSIVDAVGNAIAFEKLLGKNLHRRSVNR